MVYVTILMTVMIGMVSLSVDVGLVQTVKAQAQSTADAAALYAAAGIPGGSASSVRARAVMAAADNKVNGATVALDATNDVVFGIWDSSARTLVPVVAGAEMSATAVQVTVRCTAARGRAVNLLFAKLFGFPTADVTRTAIATIGAVTTNSVPGRACPWLAGMGSGATVAATGGNPTPAYAGTNSPILFATTAGTSIRFASAGGTTTWVPMSSTAAGSAGCEGDTTYIAAQDPANGIGTSKIPLNAMVGIFLNDSSPDSTATSTGLDFTTAASRDFTTLSPGLKQVFFIGDGVNSAGNLQTFVAPAGATRLFIGVMDEHGWWWDNGGNLTYTVVQGNSASLVK